MAGFHKRRNSQSRGHPRQTTLLVTQSAQLLEFLVAHLPDQGRNNIKTLLKHHQVSVGGQIAPRHDHLLQPGDEVTINWSLIRDAGGQRAGKVHIVYEDADIIVIDKPAGLLSIATDTEKNLTAYYQLTDYVRRHNVADRIFIVHRLDRDTSGLMLFAKSEAVKFKLQEGWKDNVVDRAYVAIVEGKLAQKSDTVRSWLLTTTTGLMYSAAGAGDGLEAVTHYRVLKGGSAYSLVELRLGTGRKNQIRVHMKDLGHPVAGDRKYGALTNPIRRLALHAHLLVLYHPITGRLMRFETEIPSLFLDLLR